MPQLTQSILESAQLVRASSCEASHQGSNPGVHTICGIKKKISLLAA
jgi:hypothetical protein